MQIVIDIPQKVYDKVLSGDGTGAVWAGYIKNGKPLPKEHGRLIDADSITYDDIVNLLITRETIMKTPTVIEEYRGGTEDGYSN